MDRILADKRLRLIYLALFFALLVITLGARIWITAPTLDQAQVKVASVEMLDRFIATSLVALFVAMVIHIGTSEIRKYQELFKILPSYGIGDRFKSAHQDATTWYFKGGLGRYFTSKTLPLTLGNGKTGYHFRAYFVNSFEDSICKYVAKHRRLEGMDEERVRVETLTTIVEFIRQIHQVEPKIQDAAFWLIDDFAPLRIDLYDDGVFITHDDKASAAMFYRKGSHFYRAYRQELTTGPNSYKGFNIKAKLSEISEDPAYVSEKYTRQALDAVTQELGFTRLDEETIKSVTEKARTRKSPY